MVTLILDQKLSWHSNTRKMDVWVDGKRIYVSKQTCHVSTSEALGARPPAVGTASLQYHIPHSMPEKALIKHSIAHLHSGTESGEKRMHRCENIHCIFPPRAGQNNLLKKNQSGYFKKQSEKRLHRGHQQEAYVHSLSMLPPAPCVFSGCIARHFMSRSTVRLEMTRGFVSTLFGFLYWDSNPNQSY